MRNTIYSENEKSTSVERPITRKDSLIKWVKNNWFDLLLVGFSLAGIFGAILLLHDDDEIQSYWNSLKEKLDNLLHVGFVQLSDLTDEELSIGRNEANLRLQTAKDFSEAVRFEELRDKFSAEINRRSWAGKVPSGVGYHREHAGIYKPD